MMSEVTYDKIIDNENIGTATLALLTNQDPLSERSAGIFTRNDLINIHKYIDFSLSIPPSNADIVTWLGLDPTEYLPIEASAITSLIQLIRIHAGTWECIEQQVKQQSINLSLTSRNIVETGSQILDYINHMPIIIQISNSLDSLSQSDLVQISYHSDDQQIATELLTILELIKEDIKTQATKTTNIRNSISDFRMHIIGGDLSDLQQVDSLLFRVKSLYSQLDSKNNLNTEPYLQEKLFLMKKEVYQLELEYTHFVKLSFTGLAGGLIGLLITGGIFGSKAEKIRHHKNELLHEINEINHKLNKDAFIKKTILDIQLQLQKIDGYFKDARLAVDHLDYMWLVILTEINQSIETFARIDNAASLLKFITRFRKIITAWASVQTYADQLIALFDIQPPTNT